jgi:hypothetical protein
MEILRASVTQGCGGESHSSSDMTMKQGHEGYEGHEGHEWGGLLVGVMGAIMVISPDIYIYIIVNLCSTHMLFIDTYKCYVDIIYVI